LVPTEPYRQWDHQSLATTVHGIGGHVAGLVERLLVVAELAWLVLAARAVRRT
jgi:hypothetical protein